jgi:hypothetical protein
MFSTQHASKHRNRATQRANKHRNRATQPLDARLRNAMLVCNFNFCVAHGACMHAALLFSAYCQVDSNAL